METNFDEDVSGLSKSELQERREKITRDKRFVNDKVVFWNTQYRLIHEFEFKLIKRSEELKGLCEICGSRKTKEVRGCLRTLPHPDNRQVCKKCWNLMLDATLLKNANNLMKGSINEII